MIQKGSNSTSANLVGDIVHQRNFIKDFIQHHHDNDTKTKSCTKKNTKHYKTAIDIDEEDAEVQESNPSEGEDQELSIVLMDMKLGDLLEMKTVTNEIYGEGAFIKVTGKEINHLFMAQ